MLRSMGEGGVADFGPFERDLGKLPGVTHVRVVPDRGRIAEIHVVSNGLKDPRQLKRDIETVAKAAHDIDLDHRVISISTMPDVDVRPSSYRFELVSIGVTTASGIAVCNVVARRGEDIGEGSSTGGATATGMPKIVGRAAIDAVSKVIGYAIPAEVANALFVPVDDTRRIATVAVMFVEEDGREQVQGGTHLVRGDQNEALARAVLDAVNRHFGM